MLHTCFPGFTSKPPGSFLEILHEMCCSSEPPWHSVHNRGISASAELRDHKNALHKELIDMLHLHGGGSSAEGWCKECVSAA
jgi:hypothetical protein